ncbi:MAG: DEAD/DEAH box helicase family protein [bacterium]|nr:DEAD/DEAH box helicase family protein [bacterium]
MSIEYKNSDFVLRLDDSSEKTLSIVNKYDAFLDALTTAEFSHVREAIKKAIAFFITDKYADTEQAAIYTFNHSEKLKKKYKGLNEFLGHIRIKDKKSFSIDLATGTGKSWVIYGVAQIMMSEGYVDKVLVLCPSLTIEGELKKKFERFSGDAVLTKILEELGAAYPAPAIKSANVPILNGDICVENIHAAYQRTGSSIEDSFKGKWQRVLVISDEAHHIYSQADADVKKWFGFLTDKEYGFQYLLGLSGTPYIGDEYFYDVIYRYSIKQAMEDGIIKKIDYKVEEESTKDKGFDETYQNHLENQNKYAGKLKPITIIITDRIVTCIQVWDNLVRYISEKESISYEQAAKKAIWVTSGIPSAKKERTVIESILEQPEKTRKDNLSLLKTVDDPENPAEWIVSVSMLTEGWDVKNVFQIVPHEQKAFNSKLLIAQVLGRGLRIPYGLKDPIFVKINNHEKWTPNIINLYNEVLEIENRISWGYDENKSEFAFPLYNLEYSSVQDTIESKEKPAEEPKEVNFSPQSKKHEETSLYSETGSFRFTVEPKDVVPIEQAAREIKLFLKDKDISISKRWSIEKIKDFIVKNLKKDGYDTTFLSNENLSKAKQSFGPMLRELGKKTPRMKMKPDNVCLKKISEMTPQFFSESSLKSNGYLFYGKNSPDSLPKEQQAMLYEFIKDKNNYSEVKEKVEKYGGSESEIRFLKNNLIEIEKDKFKTPLNLFYVSYEPERKFTRSVFNNIDLFDSVIKSPDKGLYWFPYSYKPDGKASTHVKRENFNPDFFLKMQSKNEILVVEMKADGDTNQKNRAKHRDGREHFKVLNEKLVENQIEWKYYFYFLSPEDITEFFQAIKDERYKDWKSTLMQKINNPTVQLS